MSELKALMRNRVGCCAKSGANGESKLWQSALDYIKELEELQSAVDTMVSQNYFKPTCFAVERLSKKLTQKIEVSDGL